MISLDAEYRNAFALQRDPAKSEIVSAGVTHPKRSCSTTS